MDPILATEVHDETGSYQSVLVYAWRSYIREVITTDDEDTQRAIIVYVDKTGFALNVIIGESSGDFPSLEEIFIAFRQKSVGDVDYLVVFKPTNLRHVNCTKALCVREADIEFLAGYNTVVLNGTCNASVNIERELTPTAPVYNVQYETDVVEDYPVPAFLSYVAEHSVNCFREMLFDYTARSKTSITPPSALQ